MSVSARAPEQRSADGLSCEVMDERAGKQSCAVLRGRRGSALVWALMISIVLLIIIGIMATVVQTSFHGQKVSQVKTQAYYTAQTVNDRIANWLNNTPESTSEAPSYQQQFISALKQSRSKTETYTAEQLDAEGKMGSAKAEISINDGGAADPDGAQKDTIITIKVTGYFADDSATVVSTLRTYLNASYTYQNTSFKSPPGGAFDEMTLADYLATASALNGRKRATLAGADGQQLHVVGNEDPSTTAAILAGYNDNTSDAAIAAEVVDDKEELTFMNYYEPGYQPTSVGAVSTVLGTTYYPGTDGAIGENPDKRQFVAPKNGRWLINPLLTGGIFLTEHSNDPDGQNNTRPVMLSMGDFDEVENEDLEIRLGGIEGNVPGATGAVPYNDPGYYNALIGLDFTDYEGPEITETPIANSFVEYYKNNKYVDDSDNSEEIHEWYPQAWDSMTIYTQDIPGQDDENTTEGQGVNARLVFGPFAHKVLEFVDPLPNFPYIDKGDWGRYTGNPLYGQSEGDYIAAFPFTPSYPENGLQDPHDLANRTGMAYIPEYYGNDFRMFFLDDIDKNVLLLQGVNILGTEESPSIIYSHRGVEIGGALLDINDTTSNTQGYRTNLDVNSNITGMHRYTSPNYFDVTTRYSQLLYDTDIVLLAPTGSAVEPTRASIIREADRQSDVVNLQTTNNTEFWKENKRYSPTVKIIGGRIYVGENHTLTIEGGRHLENASTGAIVDTLTVSPASITVASGGALNLLSSSIFNVNTDIFVSGTMMMQPGAKAEGAIIVNEGGVVTIGGLNNGAFAQYKGDIYVTSGGSLTISDGANATGHIYVSAGGKLNIKEYCKITGDVFCAGDLDIAGTFTLDYNPNLDPSDDLDIQPGDNPATKSIDESEQNELEKYIYHGIFLYDSPSIGTGKLTFNGQDTPQNGVPPSLSAGSSGRVHTFRSAINVTDSANQFFCYDNEHDTGGGDTHICKHWEQEVIYWVKQDDSMSVAE
jgi:hypothetical protein